MISQQRLCQRLGADSSKPLPKPMWQCRPRSMTPYGVPNIYNQSPGGHLRVICFKANAIAIGIRYLWWSNLESSVCCPGQVTNKPINNSILNTLKPENMATILQTFTVFMTKVFTFDYNLTEMCLCKGVIDTYINLGSGHDLVQSGIKT